MSVLSPSFAYPSAVTAAGGTAFTRIIPAVGGRRAKIKGLSYTSAGSQHTLTYMCPLNTVRTSGIALTGQPVVTIASDPGVYTNKRTANNPIAANDWVAVRFTDGTYFVTTVSSVGAANADGSIPITLAANLPAQLDAMCKFEYFGLPADIDPNTAEAHKSVQPPLSATTNYPLGTVTPDTIIVQASRRNDPILIHSNNATAAGSITNVSGVYAKD